MVLDPFDGNCGGEFRSDNSLTEDSVMKKRKKKLKWDSEQLDRGEAFWVKEDFYISCCECSLRHHVTVEREVARGRDGKSSVQTNKDWLILRFYTDDRITDKIQEERGIVVRKKKH